MSRFGGTGGGLVVVGHRGGRGETWPAENTLGAFARAVTEGADAIELDVRTCATGELVVFHDADLGRMMRGEETRRVAELTMRELARVRLVGGARVPALAEVLDWASTRCAVNVELKRDVPNRARLALAAWRVIRDTRSDVLVSSFDPLLVVAMGVLAPRTPRAYLTYPDAPPVFPPLGLHAVHYARHQASKENVVLALERGLKVGVWTVNDPDEARNLAALGASWVITDVPGVVRAGL